MDRCFVLRSPAIATQVGGLQALRSRLEDLNYALQRRKEGTNDVAVPLPPLAQSGSFQLPLQPLSEGFPEMPWRKAARASLAASLEPLFAKHGTTLQRDIENHDLCLAALVHPSVFSNRALRSAYGMPSELYRLGVSWVTLCHEANRSLRQQNHVATSAVDDLLDDWLRTTSLPGLIRFRPSVFSEPIHGKCPKEVSVPAAVCIGGFVLRSAGRDAGGDWWDLVWQTHAANSKRSAIRSAATGAQVTQHTQP